MLENELSGAQRAVVAAGNVNITDGVTGVPTKVD